MTVNVPLSLVIAQWTILAILSTLLVVAYRQMAFNLGTANDSPRALSDVRGMDAASFAYTDLQGQRHEFAPTTQRTLLLFIDPLCGSCDKVAREVARMTTKQLDNCRVLVVTSADIDVVRRLAGDWQSSVPVGVVADDVVSKRYRVTSYPSAFVVGPAGKVDAAAAVNGGRSVQDLVRGAGVTSLSRDIPVLETIEPRA